MNNQIIQPSRRTTTLTTLLLALANLVVCHAATDTVAIFQNGASPPFGGSVYTGCQDTFILSNAGSQTDQNLGLNSDFEVGELPSVPSSPRHALIRFDVTSLAGRFTSISRVTLRLFVTGAYDVGNGDTLQMFGLTAANSDWVEGNGVSAGAGDPPDVGMSTWAQKIQGSAGWAGSAGASTPGVDYDVTTLAIFPYASTNIAVGTYIDLALTNTSLVLDWAAGTNSGLFLRTAAEVDSRIFFASSQSATIQWRPQLIVQYAPTAPPTNLLSIRLSQVELCWLSTSNTLYQIQYRSDLTTNIWTDLGAPVQGNGTTNCVYDAIVSGQPQRFYRFVTVP